MPPIEEQNNTGFDHPLEPIQEARMMQDKEYGEDNSTLLSALLEKTDETNGLLEAQIVQLQGIHKETKQDNEMDREEKRKEAEEKRKEEDDAMNDRTHKKMAMFLDMFE
jgi:hypothetical protein